MKEKKLIYNNVKKNREIYKKFNFKKIKIIKFILKYLKIISLINYNKKMENISNKFHLSFNNEYQFWINNIIDKWIIPDYKCPKCKKNSLKIKPNKNSLSNPVHLKCRSVKNDLSPICCK